MARYIDADKFIERLKVSPAFLNMGMDGYFLLDVVENLLKKFPTADVAPKSEVAREIFEEIEKISKAPYGYFCLSNDEYSELKKKYTEETK
jgi:hypothetical protein